MFEKLHAKSKIQTMENLLTSYLTNETSFQESWIECFFALIIFITMYYLFDIKNVTGKVYVVVVNEEKQKMKQRSLFGVVL